ncbi:SRPBCC family protein [Streptomyces sp. NPDC002187]|uniref:SRPBCC family protein n=1 Tax=Streptomyces sp. NPDC002187 TaxID=3364637 RepID=UPI0036D1EF50
MKYQLRPEDLGFLERAPFRRTCTRDLRAPADAVFDQLAAHPEIWPRWFAPANDVHYEGPPPYGVGTVRFFRLYHLIRAREQIITWEPGKRFAYRAHETNAPGVTALMEQWTLAPTTDAMTNLSWTLAIDSKPPIHLLLRAGQRHIDQLFRKAMQRLEGLCNRS